uniref:Uncharacterized protein n=1 Tax=Solibacter usitatus (strain Ellin6076) TaxID=234267 RepID=Q01RI6_SOLUE
MPTTAPHSLHTSFTVPPAAKISHKSAGGGIECCGYIEAKDDILSGTTTLRCDECGQVVGTIKTGILNDLVTLAMATEMDEFVPDADHINALPGPLRSTSTIWKPVPIRLVTWRRLPCSKRTMRPYGRVSANWKPKFLHNKVDLFLTDLYETYGRDPSLSCFTL